MTNETREPDAVDDEYLTIHEVAGLLHCSRDTVERIIGRGELPYIRFSPRKRKIARADLNHYIVSRRTVGKAAS